MASSVKKLLNRLGMLGKREDRIFEWVKPYTFASTKKLRNLRGLAEALNREGIAGDFVECGTFKGGSAAVIGTQLGPARHLWLYDSFQGMPGATPQDGADAQPYVGQGVATPEDVKEIMSMSGVPAAQYAIYPGWFQETLRPSNLPERVALLHCDADWYESVLLVLRTFYPRVVEGGCIVLDDFGFWEGCREAFYDFCREAGVRPLLERFGADQAWWIKGKRTNRKSARRGAMPT